MAQNTINNQGGLVVLNPIQIADEEMYNAAMDIIEADENLRSAEACKSINALTPDNFIMEPVHTLQKPIVVDENHIALLWRDRDDPENPDMMAAILFELVERADRTYAKAPCGVIVGDLFQGIMQYRCPCCGDNETGFSMLFFLMNEEGKIEFTTRDALTTKPEKQRLFEKTGQGITVSSGQIAHILHHYAHAGAACGHNHAELPKKLSAQHPPAPK